MNIDAVGFIEPTGHLPAQLPSQLRAAGGDFGAWFEQQVAHVNQDLVTADKSVRQLASGEPVNLHQVMINLEQAKHSLQLMMQVRNRLLEAYQEVMRTQM
jgi:flagellar hook-basal body complex protein FliE